MNLQLGWKYGGLFLLVAALAIGGYVSYKLSERKKLRPMREGINALKEGDFHAALGKLLPFAHQGNPLAQRLVGDIYAYGLGVPVDERRANFWYRRVECGCIETGNLEYDVATSYLEGRALGERKRNPEAAVRWFQRAAEAGHLEAQRLLADPARLAGKGLSVDPPTSRYWQEVVRSD